ncbi:hypothetical protein FC093_14280 [Ilyomonas limi]|uniref:D-alanine--D-alanine ligase n=1 Tax=Ilyomonas limi TaxID=2575867 RepID=A0A4U3KZX5_9BACT|nr:hypothetical protein [Ilyomonas limi]TKK67459.1 hypothetical protein FC093_14280 [Ilyomonas limi]
MLFNVEKAIIQRITDWHNWPFYLFYFPLGYAWVWYYIKTRSLWFFTASNPTLTFGGFEGEAKSEMYTQLPSELYPKSIFISPALPFADVTPQLLRAGIRYPFVVKPDVGMKGLLFRKIVNEQQLKTYHSAMPATYIIQEFIDMPCEVSVFYCRKPANCKGSITAFIEKKLLEVTGNGSSTLEALISNNAEAKEFLSTIKKQHAKDLQTVLPAGETFCISHIANLYNGARFVDLTSEVNDTLHQIFDTISHQTQFLYGRYDIKCQSVEDMLQGKNFIILEFNGAGSVPNHIHAGKYNLPQAYKEILKHWKAMYEISRDNCKNGIPYWGFLKGYRFLQNSKRYFNKLKQLDKELDLNVR